MFYVIYPELWQFSVPPLTITNIWGHGALSTYNYQKYPIVTWQQQTTERNVYVDTFIVQNFRLQHEATALGAWGGAPAE